jgi:tetratricopeptide (TPR) repeat protein
MTAGVADLAALYDQGCYEEAIALGESMFGLDSSTSAFGMVRFYVAMSYLQLGRPQQGKPLVAEARAHFEAAGDAVMVVDCMFAEASVALLEQSWDAVARATAALVACRNLRPVPPVLEARILFTLGSTHLTAGEWEPSIKFYEESLERAGSLLDMRRHAKALTGLGLAYYELGQLDKAVLYTERAVALLETLRDLVSLGRAENNLGECLVLLGDLGSARTHLDRALELMEQTGRPSGTSGVLTSLCGLCVAQGDFAQATGWANEALALAERYGEGWHAVEARVWKARIAELMGDHAQADREFELALRRAEVLQIRRRIVHVHMSYGEMLEKRGDLRRAFDQMKAALSITRSGRNPVLAI